MTASHPASHVAVAITLNAKALSLKMQSEVINQGEARQRAEAEAD